MVNLKLQQKTCGIVVSVYNNKSYNDGGIIALGGAYSRVPMPISGQTEDLTVNPKNMIYCKSKRFT